VATYNRWLDAFHQACRAPKRVSRLACPGCRARKLQLRFVIFADQRPNAVFWCDGCRRGLPPAPSELPASCTPVHHADADFPNYRIVRPPAVAA
jgi:hypothetical protein